MKRPVEDWKVIRDGKTYKELAEFILDDLTHYPVTRRSYYNSDVETLANALQACELYANKH